MANRTLEITLRITVSDLSKAERRAVAKDAQIRLRDLPRLDDVGVGDMSGLISSAIDNEEARAEMFAGSDLFVKIGGVSVSSARWAED